MDDFFSNLARQVLGSQPELGPLLPPRFAAWPDLSLASPLAQPAEPVDEPASADMPLFPPPQIAPQHPASDMPLPTSRQLSQVGSGPGPSIQPDLPSMPEAMPETAGAEPGDIGQDAAPPLVPAADGSLPDATMAMPPQDVGQTRQTLPAPPAQPIVQEQAGGATDVAPGQASQPADAPVTPLVPEPALEPAAVQQQADLAQGHQAPATSPLQPASHIQPGYSSPGPVSPPADAPVTPLVPEPALEPPTAPMPAPVLQLAGPAQDHQAPATSPLQRASHTQLGEPSPGQARPPAGAPVTPLVPDPALSPLQRASHSQPGDLVPLGYSSPGQARPAESLPLGAEGPPAATGNQEAAVQEGRRVDAPPAQPSLWTRPSAGLRNGDERVDSRIWPGPAEPSIVPAPEAAVVDGWPLTAARPAWSRQRPALPPPPELLPTVRVTIGRIEVRTAPPPPAPLAPRPSPARTALSLDDYLKAGPGGEP